MKFFFKKLFTIFILLCVFIITFYYLSYTPPVLMYHNIDHNSHQSKMSVSPESFERQMKFLRDFKYHIIELEALKEYFSGGKRPPFKTVVITFDDGRLNNYRHAFPILKRYNIPATIFISPGLVGSEGYMNWDQIREMHKAGIVFGSHTMTHPRLTDLSLEKAEKEIVDSKKVIENEIKSQVKYLAYPAGGFNDAIKQLVRAAGYIAACATSPGKKYSSKDIFAIKRVRISNTSDNLFVYFIESSGVYQFIKEWRDDD